MEYEIKPNKDGSFSIEVEGMWFGNQFQAKYHRDTAYLKARNQEELNQIKEQIEFNKQLEYLETKIYAVGQKISQECFENAVNNEILNIINMETLGEKRVRTTFNPSNSSYVDEIKQKSAELINLINESAANPEWNSETFGEFMRLKALAMTTYEEAAMWAVKSATVSN